MQIDQLKPILEATLLASSQPMTVNQLAEIFTDEEVVTRERLGRALEELAADCEGRGVELLEVASGFRYQVRREVHPWISRMWTERPSRYSRALLETLALIAYRQPITRPEIEQIRGVVVSSNIIKTMEEREWIRVLGHRDVPGRPALFGTTRAFLDYFNLKSLDQLPPLSEIRDMEDPQLQLDQTPLPARIIRDLSIDPQADAAETAAVATRNATAAEEASMDDPAAVADPSSIAAGDALPAVSPVGTDTPVDVDVDVDVDADADADADADVGATTQADLVDHPAEHPDTDASDDEAETPFKEHSA